MTLFGSISLSTSLLLVWQSIVYKTDISRQEDSQQGKELNNKIIMQDQ